MLEFFKEIFSFELTWIGEYDLLVKIKCLNMWLERFEGIFLVGAWKFEQKFCTHITFLFEGKSTFDVLSKLKQTDGVYYSYCMLF